MEKHLHIVTLDIPFPVNYGGVIDLYYKIVFLARAGIKIHLHCFHHEKEKQEEELDKYCYEVNYYPRRKGHKGLSHKLPYIVSSRTSPELLDKLSEDEYPILLEGIHCTCILHDERFHNRKIYLRLHNVEYKYYRQLYYASGSLFRKIYFYLESMLLKKYEAGIANRVSNIIAVSENDITTYRKEFHTKKIEHLPVFTGFNEVDCPEGIGCFCLYHGNLSVPENEKAVSWLVTNVFNDLGVPFVIAGKNPSSKLVRLAGRHEHVCIVANPTEEEMQDMIKKAQINIIPSLNNTGIKLKLLNALYNGRHCVVNDATVEGTSLASACHVAGNASGFKSIIAQLYHKPFPEDELILRKKLLQGSFDNSRNAGRLIGMIWPS